MRIPSVSQCATTNQWLVKDGERVIHRSSSREGANAIATSTLVIQQINADSGI